MQHSDFRPEDHMLIWSLVENTVFVWICGLSILASDLRIICEYGMLLEALSLWTQHAGFRPKDHMWIQLVFSMPLLTTTTVLGHMVVPYI